jgi:hypothetical protein
MAVSSVSVDRPLVHAGREELIVAAAVVLGWYGDVRVFQQRTLVVGVVGRC